jgi:hypothetical protein
MFISLYYERSFEECFQIRKPAGQQPYEFGENTMWEIFGNSQVEQSVMQSWHISDFAPPECFVTMPGDIFNRHERNFCRYVIIGYTGILNEMCLGKRRI